MNMDDAPLSLVATHDHGFCAETIDRPPAIFTRCFAFRGGDSSVAPDADFTLDNCIVSRFRKGDVCL